MINDIAVSVVVPVYNAAPWVERCVRSLMEQTLDRVEYIFVDDCGTDGSIEIITRIVADYPERTHSVRIVRNVQNLGAGRSRKHVVDSCSGEFVCFVDADDSVEPDMLADMFAQARLKEADMVYCAITEHSLDGTVREIRSKDYASEQEMVTDLFSGLCLNLVLCCKLIRRSLLMGADIPWPDIRSHEDAVTCLPLWLKSVGKCCYLDRPYYHYHRHADSLSLPVSIASRERYMKEHEVACALFKETLRSTDRLRQYGHVILWKRLTVWDYWSKHGFTGVKLSPDMALLAARICRDVLLSRSLSWRLKLSYLRRHLGRILF